MTVKDLKIDSPVYRVRLDSIDVARVRLVEALNDGMRKIVISYYDSYCIEKPAASEIKTESRYYVASTRWYLNVEDAELAQLMYRAEHVEKLKKAMEDAQNAFAEAIQRYAFSEPSKPKEI